MAIIYLYPNSNLTPNELKSYGANGYLAIDDPYNSPDNDTTYVYGDYTLDGDWKYSHYGFGNIPYDYGIISKVTVYCRSRKYNTNTTYMGFVGGACFYLRNNGNYSLVGNGQDSYSWNTINKEYTKNPWTNLNWTFSEVNSLLIRIGSAGIKVYEPAIEDYIYATHRITQVYLKVEGTFYIIPTVTTQAVSDITYNSGKGNGEITDTGGENATERGFEYKQGAAGTIIKTYDTGSFGTGTFNKVITGLSPNTLYYVRAYAKNSAGIGYGDWVTFTTDKTTPTVVTNEATEVDKDKFKANGNITATGGENCTVRGFQYGLTPIATWDTHDEGSYEAGAFNKVISGLQANTIYYFRAYATNSVGTTYGSWLQVVTASAGTTPSGTKISLVGDYSGYVDKLHASEQDLGANYKGYFVLTTDFAEGQSLAVYKRLLYLVNYFRKETSGEVKISVKCDNETDWREIGTVDLTGDEDILMQEMGVDELGKHFLIKFEGENAFRYLGTIFWYLVQGVR
ncbi:MAG: hypothetical protein WDA59_10285 [Methanofastidiosum sp.]